MSGRWAVDLLLAGSLGPAACGALATDRDVPSLIAETVQHGETTKADLVRMFGESAQVGIDNGDTSRTWLEQLTGQLTADGVVKSHTFDSSFPEAMRRLR